MSWGREKERKAATHITSFGWLCQKNNNQYDILKEKSVLLIQSHCQSVAMVVRIT